MSREESTSERLLREIGERDRRLKDVGGNKHLRAYQGAIEPPLTSRSLLRASRRLAPDPSAAMNYGAPRSNMAREARGGRSVAQAPRAELATHAAPEPLPGTRDPQPIAGAAELGPLIRKARKRMKLNQEEFAAHAGVGRRFLSELEGGKASVEFDKVLACARAAGIDIFARPRHG
ncbi:helix-turn-helix transcriptional regulator [Sphingopyxis sp.]|jgi:y4mF family transcriptional regulator|uniref:helix-turn-helix transcriptional regulator n=1 Tax=Sphingopyxis sp. TaxID=1908224 RepID=UPI0025EF05A2|nr:helix-turn-helix transcriptional regulator [Sphingopyxis sp.]